MNPFLSFAFVDEPNDSKNEVSTMNIREKDDLRATTMGGRNKEKTTSRLFLPNQKLFSNSWPWRRKSQK